MSRALRVVVVLVATLLIAAGVVAMAVTRESGPAPSHAQRSAARQAGAVVVTESPKPQALTPEQQKRAEAAKKQFLAARTEYAKLLQAGAPESKLAPSRTKMVKAQQELKALGVTSRPRRLADGGGCAKDGGCGGKDEGGGCAMHGGKAEGGGGCSMGGGEGGCAMHGGAKAKPGDTAAPAPKAGAATQARGKGAAHPNHAAGQNGTHSTHKAATGAQHAGAMARMMLACGGRDDGCDGDYGCGGC